MAWTMVGKPISTAENSSTIPGITQRFRLPTSFDDAYLHGVGIGLIFHAAIFDSVAAEFWADRAGAPIEKIADSQTIWTKAAIEASYPKAYKFLYLGLAFTREPVKAGQYYHLAVRFTGYTGDPTNHIAWRHAYPRPQYSAGLSFPTEAIKAAVMPLESTIFAGVA